MSQPASPTTPTSPRRKSSAYSLFARAKALTSPSSSKRAPLQISNPIPIVDPPSPLLDSFPSPTFSDLALVGDTFEYPPPVSDELQDETRRADCDAPIPQSASPLTRELALLDSRLASIESLGVMPTSPSKSSAASVASDPAPGPSDEPRLSESGSDAPHDASTDQDAEGSDDDEQTDDESVEIGRATARVRSASLSAFQLPVSAALEPLGRDQGLFGKNMLWDALGLDGDDESSGSESLTFDHVLSHLKAPSADSSTSTGDPGNDSSEFGRRRASSSVSSTADPAERDADLAKDDEVDDDRTPNSSDDIFNLSEYPAFGDLPSFASSSSGNASGAADSSAELARDLATTQPLNLPTIAPIPVPMTLPSRKEAKRSSHLLQFPIPPPLSPPSIPVPSPPSGPQRGRSNSLFAPKSKWSPDVDGSRPTSPALQHLFESAASEDDHEMAHEKLVELVLANLGRADGLAPPDLAAVNGEGFGLGLGLQGLGLGLEDSFKILREEDEEEGSEGSEGPFELEETPEPEAEEEKDVVPDEPLSLGGFGGIKGDRKSALTYDFGQLDAPSSNQSYSGVLSTMIHSSSDLSSHASFPSIPSLNQLRTTAAPLQSTPPPAGLTIDTVAANKPYFKPAINEDERNLSPSARVLRKQGSLPAIFRSNSSPGNTLSTFDLPRPPPLPRSQTLDSPVLFGQSMSASPSDYSPAMTSDEEFTFTGVGKGAHSPDAVSVSGSATSSHFLDMPYARSTSRHSSRASSMRRSLSAGALPRSTSSSSHRSGSKSPKLVEDLHRASLGQLGMLGDDDIPIWNAPALPAVNSKTKEKLDKLKARSPSPAPKSMSPRSPPAQLTKRMSFASLRRRKSEPALRSDHVALPSPSSPPLPQRALPSQKLVKVEVPASAAEKERRKEDDESAKKKSPGKEETPAKTKAPSLKKRRSRLSLFIPRFGGGGAKDDIPPTPALPISLPILNDDEETKKRTVTPAVLSPSHHVAESIMTTSSLENTPQLDPPSSAFTAASEFSPATPSTFSSPMSPNGDSQYFSLAPASSGWPIGESPLPSPVFSISSTDKNGLTLDQFVSRPTRKSSIFPPPPNSAKSRTPSIPGSPPKKLVERDDPFGGHMSPVDVDVIVFPALLGEQRSLVTPSPSSRADSDEEDADAEDGDEEKKEGEEDSDDVPLSNIPGALKMQKSLKQKGSTSRTKRRLANKSDPFDLEPSTSSSSRQPLRPAQPSTLPTVPEPTAVTPVGHSLLPQTDDAVNRGIVKSPSGPLDPSIANSTLTLDALKTLEAPQRPSRPVKSATLDVLPSATSQPHGFLTRRRPTLTVNTGSSSLLRTPDQTHPPPRSPRSSSNSPRTPTGLAPAPPRTRPIVPQSTSLPVMSRQNTVSSIKGVSASPAASTLAAVTPPRAASPATEHRIFVGDHSKHFVASATATTRCGDIVAMAKARGVLMFGTEAEGGFALWEICRSLGVERPIREYEFLTDVLKTWDHDSNILLIRRTPLWPVLSAHLRPQPSASRSDWVQVADKKNKWSKRYLNLQETTLSHSKSEKGKDSTLLCQLSSFDVFFVASHTVEQLKAPKPFVFALKSLLPRAHFEEASEYCYFVSVKTADELHGWVKSIVEARNGLVRKREQSVLVANGLAPQQLPAPSSPFDTSPRPSVSNGTKSSSSNSKARAPPAHLIAALGLGPKSEPMLKSYTAPSSTGMNDAERQKWMKIAERDARNAGKPLLDFGDEEVLMSGVGVGRSKSGSAPRR
ncbi:pleckstrin-like domain-containing protein [Pseudohyphozyma bogoriensis]|nr:pleckstrin-like domain-containing protein [Pseudohyphozyma bogoriensis]